MQNFLSLREIVAVMINKLTLTRQASGFTISGGISSAQLTVASNANVSGTNTGDETDVTIKSKLGITTLSGVNTGDQTNITGNAGTATVASNLRTTTMRGTGVPSGGVDGDVYFQYLP